MKTQVLLAIRFSDTVPNFGESLPGGLGVGQSGEKVKMGRTSPLKLQNPEIPDAGELPTHSREESVKVRLDRAPVRICFVVRHAELGNESRKGVAC